jgi:hypothetical protein
MDRRIHALAGTIVWFATLSCGFSELHAADRPETRKVFQFLRPAGSEFKKETEIQLRRSTDSLVVTSVTQRGQEKLTVTSRFDSKDVLCSAEVTIQRGQHRQSASVTVTDGTARVLRDGKEAVELACPRGVIVTSAPDWTDSFMAVQRYDPNGEKTQRFPGLWIHPTGKPLELTIQLTHLGQDSVKHGCQAVDLDRYLLVLRGGSRYVVWRSPRGQLVRLVPAKSGRGGIVLAGWEQATGNLKRPPTGN